MAVVLTHNSYGKSLIRLTKVTRHADRHDLAEWSIDVRLEGDFAAAYTAGDNRQVVATDTMKNIVYVLARDHSLVSPEDFAELLADHFLNRYSHVALASVGIVEQGWQRLAPNGSPHPHAFRGQGPDHRVCRAEFTRLARKLSGGIERLLILKTTDSAFRDFHRDEFRTLPDADDRILATELSAVWTYRSTTVDATACYDTILKAMLDAFAGHRSLGVQQTLHHMGEAALDACPAIDEITLTMPNRHRIPFNLAPFNRANPNEVFVATDEPHGVITGTLRRA